VGKAMRKTTRANKCRRKGGWGQTPEQERSDWRENTYKNKE
jgi:hypothetical protein